MNLEQKLEERHIPELLITESGKQISDKQTFEGERERIKHILEQTAYGKIPGNPEYLKVETTEANERFCAGKARFELLKFTAAYNGHLLEFPVRAVIPNKAEKSMPAFVLINFRPDVPDMYFPAEEIADRGYAVFDICYTDIASDDNNFNTALSKYLKENRKKKDAPGKIAMWAWAAMRVMDYLETLPFIDRNNVAVVGHSRLGKTALVAGAFDERFRYVISNNSGCMGAALSRGKNGESTKRISEVFPFWFCPGFLKRSENAENLPYDQHFLLSLVAPRYLIIASAKEDLWADPESEFLAAVKASGAYRLYGLTGLVHEDKMPACPSALYDGEIGYHIRNGQHYFSREDWLRYMDFIDGKMDRA